MPEKNSGKNIRSAENGFWRQKIKMAHIVGIEPATF